VSLPFAKSSERLDRARGLRVRVPLFEDAVGRHRAAKRQPARLRRHRLELPAKFDLGLQEFFACPAVLVRFTREPHVVQ